MPATSVEKASRLQLRELEEINEDRKSSILSSVHMLDSGMPSVERNSSLQAGAKEEKGRAVPPMGQAGRGAVRLPWFCEAALVPAGPGVPG